LCKNSPAIGTVHMQLTHSSKNALRPINSNVVALGGLSKSKSTAALHTIHHAEPIRGARKSKVDCTSE